MIGEILGAVILGSILSWVIWDAVQRYTALPGNTPTWERLSHAFSDSATVMVSRVGQLVSAAIGLVASYGVLLDSPAVQTFINSSLGPRWMTWLMLAQAVFGEMARRRTL